MKILRLNLLAFGPFTNQVLDFERGQEGLHIVYGPNEAGKSSALRGLWQLLYGIPANSRDNFIHSHAKLRIGATLRGRDGSIVECVRRKGAKNTLLDADGEQPLPSNTLTKLLGGLEKAEFGSRFGLGHDELVKGGKAIVDGRGEMGEVLFAAGAGIATLASVRRRLENDAESLFKPQGKKPRINAALGKLTDIRKQIKAAQLPSTQWVRLDEEIKNARTARESIEIELRKQSAEMERLKRIAAALPVIAGRQALLKQLQPVADSVLLSDDFGEQRRAAMTEMEIATAARRDAEEALKLIDRAIDETSVSQAILNEAESIATVFQELGGHRKAANDRPALNAKRQQAGTEAERILLDLGREANLAEADNLRLSTDKRTRIQELGDQYQELIAQRKLAQIAYDDVVEQLDQIERQSLAQPPQRDATRLRQAIRRAQQRGDLDAELAHREKAFCAVNENLGRELARLPLWSGALEELEKLPVPEPETVGRFESDLDGLESDVKGFRNRVLENEDRASEIDTEMANLEGQRQIPTKEDLRAARAHRDEGWRLVKRAAETGETDTEEIRAFIGSEERASDLWRAYEMSVERADATADLMHAEAQRVTRKATLVAERGKLDEKTRRLNELLREVQAKHDQTWESWCELWAAMGIEALSPREMRAWMSRQQTLATDASVARQQELDLEACRSSIDSIRFELADCLKELEPSEMVANESLAALFEQCETACEKVKAALDDVAQREHDTVRLGTERAKAKRQLAAAEKDLAEWRRKWADAIVHVDLNPDATPREANDVMDRIQEMFNHLKKAEEFQGRISGIDRDLEHFTESVKLLVTRVADDLADHSAEQAASELNARLTHAHKASAKLLQLNERREKEDQKIQTAAEEMRGAEATLDALMKEAGCSSPDELAAAEVASRRRVEIERELAEQEKRIIELAAGSSMEDFLAEAETVDFDQVPYMLEQLEGRIVALGDEKSNLDQTIGRLVRDLDAMDGGSTAAAANEEKEQWLSAIRADAADYARAQLAAAVLRDAIERYRQEHQGPVLERASELFSELTLGSFSGLRVDYDEKDNAVLGGVRSGGGDRVLVDGMSDGTCDQLYLALRLAGIETFLAENEPIPLVIDDLLIRFDDARATATLKALARLSEQTQVVYFTHHAHLLDLAEEVVDDDDVLFRYDLDCRGAAEAVSVT